jgi:hypothetical protein
MSEPGKCCHTTPALTLTTMQTSMVKAECPFRKSYPDVLVVQPGQDWDGDYDAGPLDCPTQRRVFAQGQVRAHLIVIYVS